MPFATIIASSVQQNYLTKMDLDSTVFFHKYPIFMSIQIPSGITMTRWT